MNQIIVNWTQIQNVLVAEVMKAPNDVTLSLGAYTIYRSGGSPTLVRSQFDLGVTVGATSHNYVSEEDSTAALHAFKSLISQYNAEHQPPKPSPIPETMEFGGRRVRICRRYHTDYDCDIWFVDPEGRAKLVRNAHGKKGFAGYVFRFADGTIHILAVPVAYTDKHGNWSDRLGNDFNIPAELIGVAFWEDA